MPLWFIFEWKKNSYITCTLLKDVARVRKSTYTFHYFRTNHNFSILFIVLLGFRIWFNLFEITSDFSLLTWSNAIYITFLFFYCLHHFCFMCNVHIVGTVVLLCTYTYKLLFGVGTDNVVYMCVCFSSN